MFVSILLSVLPLIAMTARTIFAKKKYSYACYLFGAALCAILAYLGMDFSPSFTAIFLFVFYSLFFLSEAIRFLPVKKQIIVDGISFVCRIIATLFLFPSLFIYLAGDDGHYPSLTAAVLVGVLLIAVCVVILGKKKLLSVRALDLCEAGLLLIAGLYALFGGITSTATLPYGAGLLLCACGVFLKDKIAGEWLVLVGLVLTNVFLWAPMVF